MSRLYDVITFDCFGTLVDWERGILDAFAAATARDGRTFAPEEILAAYMDVEPMMESGKFRRYRDVLDEAARRVAASVGWTVPKDRAHFLSESLPRWPVFPDSVDGLARLKRAGYRLGLLTNCDDALLVEVRRALGDPFDPALVITAEKVSSYKPAHKHFTTARDRMRGARWLHAAQSWFHDMEPARALGIEAAWINRKGEAASGGWHPAIEAPSVGALADRLT